MIIDVVNKYLRLKWQIREITKEEQMFDLQQYDCDILAIDTETTGLHIVLDNPFCITFAMSNLKDKFGIAYILNLDTATEKMMVYMQNIIHNAKLKILWNAKYDGHMLYNKGLYLFQGAGTVVDVAIIVRLSVDAIPSNRGGDSLELKAISKKYIDPDADIWQKKVNMLKKQILMKQNELLKPLVAKLPENLNTIGKLRTWLDDLTNDVYDLPKEISDILLDEKLNPNNYHNIPWDDLKVYAAYDVIYTTECYLYFKPIMENHKQQEIFETETKDIPILWKMERQGLKLNKFYSLIAKENVRQYLLELRQKSYQLAGKVFSVSQHKLIKQIFLEKYNLDLESTDKDALEDLALDGNELAKVIVELRTLEKWYSTYICKWLKDAEKTDRVYTSFNQVGAVSGRFSSDFQQFPKEALTKSDGTELFHPRRMIMADDDSVLCFIDFSAEELRFQAAYTILIGKPDINMVRAYIPYQCDPETWKPTDLHSLTTITAFPELKGLDKEDPHFHKMRYYGKRANFCINYGGTARAIQASLKLDKETSTKLYNAYYEAYPNVKEYRKYVANVLAVQPYITNLFGRRYYGAPAHNCCNYLIQGSGADLLKQKLIELDQLLKPYKSYMVCMIHDEIVYSIKKDEMFLIPKIKAIMEGFKELPIPLISEVEVTDSTWDRKEEYKI